MEIVTDIPAIYIDSAYVSLYGQLLAIGGLDSENKPSTAVHMYDPSSNSWEVIIATWQCHGALVMPLSSLTAN